MTANRIYRKQMDFSYVLGELERGRGTQFDPTFVDLLLKLINDGTIDLTLDGEIQDWLNGREFIVLVAV